MATLIGEPRARRTHARRSCDLCKVRKTRCELPDLDVPSSTTPLPADKSCHRCRVLALPCVVDDSRMQKRKKKGTTNTTSSSRAVSDPVTSTSAGNIGPARTPTRKARTTTVPLAKTGSSPLEEGGGSGSRRRATVSRQSSAPVNPVDHNVDISGAFPLEHGQSSVTHGAVRPNVHIQGRPLTLVGAMLNVAYAKMFQGLGRHIVIFDDADLEHLVEPIMRTRLGAGFSQLRTIHPHLQSLQDLLKLYRSAPTDVPIQLLLTTSVYIAAQSLASDPEGLQLRDQLAPFVSHLIQLVLSRQPRSFHAIQALEILAIHVPFSPALPLQLTDPRTLAPARGLITTACNISDMLHFNSLINSGIEHWPNPDYWLWLGVRIGEAQMALEDERPRKPALLTEARVSTMEFTSPERDGLWTSVSFADDSAELLGKLTVCDRIARLDELHGSITRLKSILETTASVANYNATRAILKEFELFAQRMAVIDTRHDEIFGMLALPRSLVSAWCSYRMVRRRFETMKQYSMGIQALVALHYLPGSIVVFPNLPNAFSVAAQAVHYSLNRSSNPSDILQVHASNTLTAEEVRRMSRACGELAEQQLGNFVELSRSILPNHGGPADIIPLHEVIAIVLDSAKVLVETHSANLRLLRMMVPTPSVSLPRWVPVLIQVGHVMRSISLPREKSESEGGESVANGCANLVGSTVRAVNEWTGSAEQEMAAAGGAGPSSMGMPTGVPFSLSASPQLPSQQPMRSQTPTMGGPVVTLGYGPLVDHAGAYHVTRPSSAPSSVMNHLGQPMHPTHLLTATSMGHQAHQQESLDSSLAEMFGFGYASLPQSSTGYSLNPLPHVPSPEGMGSSTREMSPYLAPAPVQQHPRVSASPAGTLLYPTSPSPAPHFVPGPPPLHHFSPSAPPAPYPHVSPVPGGPLPSAMMPHQPPPMM